MSIEQIENNLKNILKDLTSSKVKNVLETEAVKSIMRNFEQGGRPEKWIPTGTKLKTNKAGVQRSVLSRKSGKQTLIDSGNMSQITAHTQPAADGFEIVLMPGPKAKAYSRIQHEGGAIRMPGRKIRFRENKSGRTVFAKNAHKRITKESLAKPYTINIPARPYLLIPEEDYSKLLDAVASAIKL